MIMFVLPILLSVAPVFSGGIQISQVSNYTNYCAFSCSGTSPSITANGNGEHYVFDSYFEVHGRYYFDQNAVSAGAIWIDDVYYSVIGCSSLTNFTRLDFSQSGSWDVSTYLTNSAFFIDFYKISSTEVFYQLDSGEDTYPSANINVTPYYLEDFEQNVHFGLSFDVNIFSTFANEYARGFSQGYNEGYSEGRSEDDTVTGIFTGILEIALTPVNFFLAVLNFDILGINIANFVTALLTVVVVIWLVRAFIGNNKGGD